jgi:hypothetical protein
MGVLMLRRAENVRLGFAPSVITGMARPSVDVGKKSYRLATKIHKDQWAAARQQQRTFPVLVLRTADRNLWQFQDRFYWDTDQLDPHQVYALLVTRQQRERQRIDRAQAMIAYGSPNAQSRRTGIPDDLKQLVWLRDRGRCRYCGSTIELQYDHIIPVALGGATSAENLQILCGPCNRKKGAGLTIR